MPGKCDVCGGLVEVFSVFGLRYVICERCEKTPPAKPAGSGERG